MQKVRRGFFIPFLIRTFLLARPLRRDILFIRRGPGAFAFTQKPELIMAKGNNSQRKEVKKPKKEKPKPIAGGKGRI